MDEHEQLCEPINESGLEDDEQLSYEIAIKALPSLNDEEWKFLVYKLGIDLDRLRNLLKALEVEGEINGRN